MRREGKTGAPRLSLSQALRVKRELNSARRRAGPPRRNRGGGDSKTA